MFRVQIQGRRRCTGIYQGVFPQFLSGNFKAVRLIRSLQFPSTSILIHPSLITLSSALSYWEHIKCNEVKGSLYVPQALAFNNSTFYRHIEFICFVWIWKQTAIISLYSIDLLVFVTETECVYCAVRSTFYVLPTQCIYVFCVDLRTNSDYFTVQHWLVGFCNWDGVCLLRGTFYILHSAHTVYLCVLCRSENKQRLFHCTALTGWFL